MAHGHDEISIRMLKMCSSSVCRPLQIIYYLVFCSSCQFIEIGQATPIPAWYRDEDFLVSNDYT